VIVITNDSNHGPIVDILRANKYKFAEGGSLNVLATVRSWEYGVLLLSKEEGRGVDTRFKRDAFVLIACQVSTHHELSQMVGRSSRSRGVCEGVLYTVGEDRPVQVMEKLKRQSVSSM
jgi:hypothetical protein